jgi:hypothetical protein
MERELEEREESEGGQAACAWPPAAAVGAGVHTACSVATASWNFQS